MTRERRFLTAVLAGTGLLVAGLVTLVLAVSVTVRDPVGVSAVVRTAGVTVGLALLSAGLLARRSGGRGRRLAAAGALVAVAAASTATSGGSDAPMVSQIDRWALGAAALLFVAGSAWLFARAAAAVGLSR